MCSTATAWHALKLSGIRSGESLAIIGFGGLGVSAIQLARVLGVSKISVVDVVPEKLKLAASFGVVTCWPEVDVPLELAGNAAACVQALRSLEPGGPADDRGDQSVACDHAPCSAGSGRDQRAR